MSEEVRPIKTSDAAVWPALIALDGTAAIALVAAAGSGKKHQITGILVSTSADTTITFHQTTGSPVVIVGPIALLAKTTLFIPFPHTKECVENASITVTSSVDLDNAGFAWIFGYTDYGQT